MKGIGPSTSARIDAMKCERCGEDGAGSTNSESVALCNQCRRRSELQEQYDLRLPDFAKRIKARDYSDALKIVDTTEAELKHLETEGWLTRTLMLDRAMVLEMQGMFEEALVQIERRLELPFEEHSERASTLLSGAMILNRLGRMLEARSYMSNVLEVLDLAHPKAALPKLLRWLQTGDESLLAGRRETVDRALQAHGLQPPDEVATDPIAALHWARRNWDSRKP